MDTFKNVYHYDKLPITGLKRVQNLMYTIVAAYNLIRLFNLIKEHNLDLHSYQFNKIRINELRSILKYRGW